MVVLIDADSCCLIDQCALVDIVVVLIVWFCPWLVSFLSYFSMQTLNILSTALLTQNMELDPDAHAHQLAEEHGAPDFVMQARQLRHRSTASRGMPSSLAGGRV